MKRYLKQTNRQLQLSVVGSYSALNYGQRYLDPCKAGEGYRLLLKALGAWTGHAVTFISGERFAQRSRP